MARTISFTLSPKSIQNIKEDLMKNYRGRIQKQITREVMSQMKTLGVEIIKTEIQDALMLRLKGGEPNYTGHLMNSVVADGRIGSNLLKFRVEAPYGAYVEFGTGVIGRNSKIDSSYQSKHGWKHDINRHGLLGWFYYDELEGRLRWTQGQEATSFMLNSSVVIRKQIRDLFIKYGKEGGTK